MALSNHSKNVTFLVIFVTFYFICVKKSVALFRQVGDTDRHADILFAFEQSEDDYYQLGYSLDFAADIIRSLDIGPNASHVGWKIIDDDLTSFNTATDEQIANNLTTKQVLEQFEHIIPRKKRSGRNTHGLAVHLKAIRQSMLAPHLTRKDVPRILILFSGFREGRYTEEDSIEAKKLKQDGIFPFLAAFGQRAMDKTYFINLIRDDKFCSAYVVPNLQVYHVARSLIWKDIAYLMGTTSPEDVEHKVITGIKADIYFLVEYASFKTWMSDFRSILDFIVILVKQMKLGRSATRIGFGTLGNSFQPILSFEDSSLTKKEIISRILDATLSERVVVDQYKLHSAMDTVIKNEFTEQKRREDVPRILVALSHHIAKYKYTEHTTYTVDNVSESQDVYVYSIGAGRPATHTKSLQFQAPTFEDLHKLAKPMLDKFQEATHSSKTEALIVEPSIKADIYFLIDAHDLDKDAFMPVLRLVIELVKRMDIGPNATRVGYGTLGMQFEHFLSLDESASSKSYTISRLKAARYQQGLSYPFYSAVERALDFGLDPKITRKDVPQMLVLLSNTRLESLVMLHGLEVMERLMDQDVQRFSIYLRQKDSDYDPWTDPNEFTLQIDDPKSFKDLIAPIIGSMSRTSKSYRKPFWLLPEAIIYKTEEEMVTQIMNEVDSSNMSSDVPSTTETEVTTLSTTQPQDSTPADKETSA